MPRVSAKSAQNDTNNYLVKLGASLRARRKDLGLSQESLADAAGIDRSHMGKIERGERNITFLNIVRITDALGCTPSDVMIDSGF